MKDLKSKTKNTKIIMDNCRLCKNKELTVLHDFGFQPVAGYLESSKIEAINAPKYRNIITICNKCGHVQQGTSTAKETLINKVYSNYQSTYAMSGKVSDYMQNFLNIAIKSSKIQKGDILLEIGSNDGSILRAIEQMGYISAGFDPSAQFESGNDTKCLIYKDYFTTENAVRFTEKHQKVKLLITRHTFEHVFDPIDFLMAINNTITDDGTAVIEIPYFGQQIVNNQFQSLTFQHISFFTISSFLNALKGTQLVLNDLVFSKMDAGSMVLFLKKDSNKNTSSKKLLSIIELENMYQLGSPEGYSYFFSKLEKEKILIMNYFKRLKEKNILVMGFGAGTKGQAMLNMLGLSYEILPYIIDYTPAFNNQFVPGTGNMVIPPGNEHVKNVDAIFITAPTHISEIMKNNANLSTKDTFFFSTVPAFHVEDSI